MLASLRYQPRIPASIDPAAACQVLAPALDRARRALDPATPDQIVKGLRVLAETLQCSIPEEDGLTLYVAVLQRVSYLAFRQACIELAAEHEWPRLPLPKEVLDAAAPVQSELRFWEQNIARALKLVTKEDQHP